MSTKRDGSSEISLDKMPSPLDSMGPSPVTASSECMGVSASSTGWALAPKSMSTEAVSKASKASPSTLGMQLSRAEVVARTVHLRCLPPFMSQRVLADVFDQCGEYLRVRICGNASTHQKWVYGFVEFSSVDAAAKMITHCGMELPNGPDKPPLRLKCSPSKQPILDCMAYDADVVEGTPCGFGRGYLADRTLNDVLLVVGSGGGVAATPSAAAGAGCSSSRGCSGGGTGDYRTRAATNALTALTLRSMRKVAATGCGCGCSGVNCCGCCHCWKGLPEPAEAAGCAAGDLLQCGAANRAATDPCGTESTDRCVGSAGFNSAPGSAPIPSGCCSGSVVPVLQPAERPSTHPGLGTPLVVEGGGESIDVLQQLSATFEGLRRSVLTVDQQLDGASIVRRGESMVLDAMCRVSHLASEADIQGVLSALAQILDLLDSNAAVTGGAEQTASGGCTATVPQCVTQLRMLTNLLGALVCLLRRSVVDALPYVEAVLMTFAHIPLPKLLLHTRAPGEKAGVQDHLHAHKTNDSLPPEASHLVCSSLANAAAADAPADLFPLTKRRPVHRGSLSSYVDQDVAGSLLDMVDEDEDGVTNRVSCEAIEAVHTEVREHSSEEKTLIEGGANAAVLLKGPKSCICACSDAGDSFLHSGEMDVCRRREETFWRYVLNVLVCVGLSMEEVHPDTARSAYMLANARAAQVLGAPSKLLQDCLAASATGNPRVCVVFFPESAGSGRSRDITSFPHIFFEGIAAVRHRISDLRGKEDFWRELPPNDVVSIFQ